MAGRTIGDTDLPAPSLSSGSGPVLRDGWEALAAARLGVSEALTEVLRPWMDVTHIEFTTNYVITYIQTYMYVCSLVSLFN